MKPRFIRLLLSILNSHCLNKSPCAYGYIGNVSAFSYEYLRSEVKQRPEMTVATLLAEAEAFKTCPIAKGGLTVIENRESREGTIWDVHELQHSLNVGGSTKDGQ